MSLLSCPSGLSASDAQTRPLDEVAPHPLLTYALRLKATFCIQVSNTSSRPLKVTLMNCAQSGAVEYAASQVISPGSSQRFWNQDKIGATFTASPAGIDRLVAIGTTRLEADLSFLRSKTRFSELVDAERGKLVAVRGLPRPPAEQWTAAEAILGIGIR